ncbi:aldo/keto reductase [Rhodoligotrophos defluvii]|uniref:aldo/keto reductase n=1 Tax=Rhodoligotrophos defluvii TaxID=2561934 RepID=UPI001485121C|nr:aldo/keto reductase [Rhodoligotrophos defluvii]
MVRQVKLPGTEIETSVIGFGCASLGSRISRAQGLRSLEAAFDAGVTWYDVAPPYGAGEAELAVGAFLRERRQQVQVCTKVGLTHPERNQLMKMVYAAARPVAGKLKALRRGFRALPATRYRKVPLDGSTIKASLDQSLTRLGTDYVDVFALHDPDPADVTREDVLRALEEVVRAGKARHVSVAGSLRACLAGAAQPGPFSFAQCADGLDIDAVPQIARAARRPIATVTHSVFGVDGALERLVQRLAQDPQAQRQLAEAGYAGPLPDAAGALLLDRALAANPQGVVLTSMFSERHRRFNIARASRPASRQALDLAKSLTATPAPGLVPA